ncbi:MAG TPA: 3-methyl-2-oxobutanoate hydroxymethyltransferase [Methylotenera sp.]|nr:3-methyl-2-oxobutanoate hydroxymethyltransferase [Methylotenera sp.]HPH05515.1 3-methyl-2-oxobutanoate hydroxymethyltransferase [Methylotenera sp.]HPN00071.1 3-methyl-2-oxobutanoate hydroxymethyltransferase [Methylotenera sp.]
MLNNLSNLIQSAKRGEKIAMLTCYDASFAKLMEIAGVDMLLVGDSLGMVLQGAENTLNVSMHHMTYHTKNVAAGAPNTVIMADMPLGSYEHDHQAAFTNAQWLIKSGAHLVKFEGGGKRIETARYLVEHGIPVCAHLGFTPQMVNQLGGYKIQGKTEESAEQILQDAKDMSDAGVSFVLLEMVPAQLAKKITQSISAPTIGIGAGVDCCGQVLVIQDLLGIYTGPAHKKPEEFKSPRFVSNFLQDTNSVQNAVKNYVQAVKNKTFPAAEHSY